MILLIITLLTLVSCGEEKAQLASPVNVFKSKTVTLPETYQTVSPNIIDLGGRIGVVCHDGYNPEMNFDSVLYTIDKNGETRKQKCFQNSEKMPTQAEFCLRPMAAI